MAELDCSIVLPARLESTRLPRKLLLSETGRSMIAHTLDNLAPLREKMPIYVATDCGEIAKVAESAGVTAVMTDSQLASGTERIAATADRIQTRLVLNVQADEPEVNCGDLLKLVRAMNDRPDCRMGTLGAPFSSVSLHENPNAVKALCRPDNTAIYFSRLPIPYGGSFDFPQVFHHIGVYAYTLELLKNWASLPKGRLEGTERLEQLRAIENNIPLLLVPVGTAKKGIDTLEDYQAFVKRQKNQHG